MRQPVHPLRRRAQGQPPVASSPPRGPSTPSRCTSASRAAWAPPRGVFGAQMEVELVNDGPVTLLLEHVPASLPPPMPPDRSLRPPLRRRAAAGAAALRPLGADAARRSSSPRACASTTRARTRRARRGRLVPGPHLGRAHVRPRHGADGQRLRAVRLRQLRARRRRRGARATSTAPPTAPPRPPRPTPTGQIDLCEEVVGSWRGEQGKAAAMTLVWGRPLVDGGAVVDRRAGRPHRRPVRAARGPLHAAGARRLPRRHARREGLRPPRRRARARVALRRGRRRGRGRGRRGGARGGDPHAPHAQGLRRRAGRRRHARRAVRARRAGRRTTTSPTRGASASSGPARSRG